MEDPIYVEPEEYFTESMKKILAEGEKKEAPKTEDAEAGTTQTNISKKAFND